MRHTRKGGQVPHAELPGHPSFSDLVSHGDAKYGVIGSACQAIFGVDAKMASGHDARVPTVGQIIRKWRDSRRGLSQEALGAAANVDKTLIGKYERGNNQPTVPQLAKIAHAFGVEGDDSRAVARFLLGPGPDLAELAALRLPRDLLLQHLRQQEGVQSLDVAENRGHLASEQAQAEARTLQVPTKPPHRGARVRR